MAKSKEKNRRGSKAEFRIRTVKTKEDRKRPSVFMRLKTEESFKGIALFNPDPELKDNPGYYEYYDHYDKQGNAYVPCAGDRCPFCAANDNPSTRALTVWYFPDASDVKDQIKVFTMNYSTINDIADESEEEDGIVGKRVRIKRLSDKGDYKVKVLTDKPLTKKELEKVMKLLVEKFPDALEGLVMRQLKIQMERLKAQDDLEDDEDDDDEPKSKSRRGKEEDDDDDDDEDDEDEDDDDDDDDDDDEDEKDDDDDVDDDDEDEDDDEDADDDEDEDDDDEKEDEDDDATEAEAEAEEISGGLYEVVKIQEKDEIFDLKNDDGKVKMWLGEGVEVDYDEVKKGVSIKLDATQDDEGDWIMTALEVAKDEKKKAPKKDDKKKAPKKDDKKKK